MKRSVYHPSHSGSWEKVPHSDTEKTWTIPLLSVVVEEGAVVYGRVREEGAHTEGLLGRLEDRRTVDVTTMPRGCMECEMIGGSQVAGRHAVNL